MSLVESDINIGGGGGADWTLLTLAISVILAAVGYGFTLYLSKRKDRLTLVSRRINEFYGPLYIATRAGGEAYGALYGLIGPTKKLPVPPDGTEIFDGKTTLPDERFAVWRLWAQTVFKPLNDLREKLILKNAHLIRDETMPDCIIEFMAHVSAWKPILKNWENSQFDGDQLPGPKFPTTLHHYLENHYQELKLEQLNLMRWSGRWGKRG